MALAQALPTSGFHGQEQVVPLLADALSQTGEEVEVAARAKARARIVGAIAKEAGS